MPISSIHTSLCSTVDSPHTKYQNRFFESTAANRNTGPDTVSISQEALAIMHTKVNENSPKEAEERAMIRVPFIRLAGYIQEAFESGQKEVALLDDIPASSVEWHDVPIEVAVQSPLWEPFLNQMPIIEATLLPLMTNGKPPAEDINKNSFSSTLMEDLFPVELEKGREGSLQPVDEQSIFNKVTHWYTEVRNSPADVPNQSQWLPENYGLYHELIAREDLEGTHKCKLNMVFDAVATDKVLSEKDIANGIRAINLEMSKYKNPTTAEELYKKLRLTIPDNTEGLLDMARAEKKYQEWLKADESQKALLDDLLAQEND